jgi:sporulation protein YlmC with PRC-barrel domain
MADNRFESSRVASSTLNPGAQNLPETSHQAPSESSAVSRDDVRDGFEEENQRHVLAASTLTGDRVRNSAGESLGKIEEIMLDIQTGRIAYAVLSFGGFLGIGNKLFAVPWSALQIDTGEHEFILDVDRGTLENAPGFDKDDWPDMTDPDFVRDVSEYYGKTPFWEHNFTEAGDYTGDNRQPNPTIEEPVSGFRPAGKH